MSSTILFCGGYKYRVQSEGEQKTSHEVGLTERDYLRLRAKEEKSENLIHRSIEFLLEREANTSILSSFNLPLIETYFSDYPSVISMGLFQYGSEIRIIV